MRLTEIEFDINNALTQIKTRCQQFIRSTKITNKFLYRGIFSDNEFFKQSSPANRWPIGQSRSEQMMLDYILKLTGFTSLRSNSICCTANESSIENFGDPYIIFPIDGFTFTWSSTIEDIGGNSPLFTKLHDWVSPKNSASRTGNIPTKIEATAFINEFDFRHEQMPAALESGNEITIHGDYFAISQYFINDVSEYFDIELGA